MLTVMAAQTEFSLGESILKPKVLAQTLAEMKQSAAAITDTMSVNGMIEFSRECQQAGIKPIIGCRLRLVDDPSWRRKRGVKDRPPTYYLNWYCLTETGVKALFALLTLANSDQRFYEVPKISFDDLNQALDNVSSEDVVIATSASHSVILHDDAEKILQDIVARVSASNTFATITPANTPYWDSLNLKAIALAQKLGIRGLLARPAHYGANQADAHEIMSSIWNGDPISSIWHRSNHLRDFEPLDEKRFSAEILDMAKRLHARGGAGCGAFIKQAIGSADEIATKVTYTWSKQPVSLPKLAADEYERLRELCKIGWKERFSKSVFGHSPTAADLKAHYVPRLSYELQVLKQLGFSGYFLLVHDLVQHAKSSGILVGPGRGSVGGSLVAYLTGITDCDPIRFNLLFERFINPDRLDLPDADLDFMSSRRHEVVEYLTKKYGAARVAGISNYGTLQSASTIRSVGKSFGLSEREYDCSKLAPKEHGQPVPLKDAADQVAEIGTFRDRHAGIWDICLALEGTLRNMSQHAAGVVVAGCDLTERAVVEKRKEGWVVNWDKSVVEEMGLIKIDVLGLNTLDLIAQTLSYIRQRHTSLPDLSDIGLDDPKVLSGFAAGQTTGVFQFESGGMKKLLKDLGRDGTLSFEDITAATALYRPGPMDSGMLDSYVKRKQGRESVIYEHPRMADALSNTFGVMVYQEQVMQIARDIAGYSMADADKLRKIMGKKQPEEMQKQRGQFVFGCVSVSAMSEREAEDLFDKIATFAGYGFNRSHSVEYSLISYQCMFLKIYYPVEFIAAALSLMSEDKLPALLNEAKRLGITVDLPDVNLSTDVFEIVTDTCVVVPFGRIKGISNKTAAAVIEERAKGLFADKADFEKRVRGRNCNIKHITNLDLVGAFARIEPGQKSANHPDRIRDQIELIPGLVSAVVPINREMETDKETKQYLALNIAKCGRDFGPSGDSDGLPVRPLMGKNASFMAIFDAPNSGEDSANQMTQSQGFASVLEAMGHVGMTRQDGYWTSLLRRPKAGKQITPEEVASYAPYLKEELRLLRPPLIVLLGSQAVRFFFPDFKGKASDSAGKIIYRPDYDANFVFGFSPGEIYFDETKQSLLDDVFAKVASILDTSA